MDSIWIYHVSVRELFSEYIFVPILQQNKSNRQEIKILISISFAHRYPAKFNSDGISCR